MATGTVSISEERFGSLQKVMFEWTSTAGGAAGDTTVNPYNGEVIRLVTIPDGTDTPTDLYDVEVTDEDGVDVLNGSGADQSNSETQQTAATLSLGVVANDKLTLSVTNAGNAKSGKVILYIR